MLKPNPEIAAQNRDSRDPDDPEQPVDTEQARRRRRWLHIAATVFSLLILALSAYVVTRTLLTMNYTALRSAIHTTTLEQFLPIEVDLAKKKSIKDIAVHNFIFEPSEEEIINDLIPMSLKTNFFRVILESIASEHGARMTAMDNATENAEELIDELLLGYNKARQASITKEILEIVSGANALKEG